MNVAVLKSKYSERLVKRCFIHQLSVAQKKKIRNKQIFHDASKRKGWDEVVVLCIIFAKKVVLQAWFFFLHIIMAKDSLLILSAHSSYLLGDHELQTEDNFNSSTNSYF